MKNLLPHLAQDDDASIPYGWDSTRTPRPRTPAQREERKADRRKTLDRRAERAAQ